MLVKILNTHLQEEMLAAFPYLYSIKITISLWRLFIPRLDSIRFRIKFYTVIILYGVVVFHAWEMISLTVAITNNFCFLLCFRGWRCFYLRSCCCLFFWNWNWRCLWCWSRRCIYLWSWRCLWCWGRRCICYNICNKQPIKFRNVAEYF